MRHPPEATAWYRNQNDPGRFGGESTNRTMPHDLRKALPCARVPGVAERQMHGKLPGGHVDSLGVGRLPWFEVGANAKVPALGQSKSEPEAHGFARWPLGGNHHRDVDVE